MSFIYEKDLPDYLLSNYGLRVSKKGVEKLRARGQGPVFRKWFRFVVYDIQDVKQWVMNKTARCYTYTQSIY